MTLRRALRASPLAVLVAVLAHFTAFGFGHAPGAEHASDLLGTLGAALGLGVFGVFAAGVLGLRTQPESGPADWSAPLILAAAATASFAGIEISEGHFALRTLLEAACFSLPLAYFVALVARSTRAVVRAAGVSYGNFLRRALCGPRLAIARIVRQSRVCIADSLVTNERLRGRAPPVLI